jgi:hypothetical protein
LTFPNSPGLGEDFSPTKPRNPRNTTHGIKKLFRRLGFADLRQHDLRGTHDVVAARGGHDPAVQRATPSLLTKKADEGAVISALAKGALGKRWECSVKNGIG